MLVKECPPESTELSIIIHGWTESYQKTLWVPDFMSNLTEARKGCHLFMDYSKYAAADYGTLVINFKYIMPALVNQFKILFDDHGYDGKKAFIFGFSYGAHLAVQSSHKFGMRRIGRIDVCDPAGPSFFGDIDLALKYSLAADYVQCIHTSIDKGTYQRYCPFSWNMGSCGHLQEAATVPPRMSHGLCPYIYTSAFKNDFKAVPNKRLCATTKAGEVKEGLVMGYRMNFTLVGAGEFYADTSKKPTFN
ncbi:hepatic triacylglycerol lipase-like [Culicoides brevitarsis]|uniref:hepatic triacylglycerol lipase-like n=1 Tax=Culicoides brevitarsis TaxID=469753 RepID=UPI00307C481C